jgi:transcriptional regulator with XRE-family HTH domain
MIENKIKLLRKIKNLTQEDMASKLYISPSAYHRLEASNEDDISLGDYKKIATVFGFSLSELINSDSFVFNNTCSNNGTQGIRNVENFFSESKDLYQKIIDEKNSEIEYLRSEFDKLLKHITK